jgi:hypothetical protein
MSVSLIKGGVKKSVSLTKGGVKKSVSLIKGGVKVGLFDQRRCEIPSL